MNDIIIKERFMPFPIDKVWSAISNQEKITAWFLKADFKAEVGYDYTLTYDKGVIKGKILEVNPVNNLVYSWLADPANTETIVKWTLSEEEGGTKIYLEHSGINNFPTEAAAMFFENFSGGWDNCFNNLNKYLEEKNVEASV